MTDVQTRMHSLLLFIRWEYFFCFTSYAQQIQRQTCSKPQTKFLHRRNPASHFKMAPPPPPNKKQPFTFVVQFHILTDRFTAISCLAEWHEPRSEYHFLFLTETHFPFKQIALFFLSLLVKTTSTGL